MASVEYRLSCELRGHEDDVRQVCVCGNSGIASSSRDKTVRFWQLNPANKYSCVSSITLLGHSSFVGPLAWIPPSNDFPEGRLVSGGMDTLVLIWDLKTANKVQTLKGHTLQVTGVAVDNDKIISCSQDCSIRCWQKGETVNVWNGHKAAVQIVIKLPTDELLTGSSDMTIKMWVGEKCLRTFSGHTDTVRGLALMPGLGFLSASHDGSIRLWALSGEVLLEMVGHTSIVYSVDAHVSGLIVSGSEDCSARIWRDGVCVQRIDHPGCVWDVKFLENGDIVSACSDGVLRIWTPSDERVADSPVLDSYASLLSHHKASRKASRPRLEQLPGSESLRVPGTRDGQTKMIREGDGALAYSWNARERVWDKIGEVVDGPEESGDGDLRRPVLDGVEYDYVFNVDIGDGEPVRRLPYNRSDDPYAAADRWLMEEGLPMAYREQVVRFVVSNSGRRDFVPDPSFRDPYTGSGAYVPGARPPDLAATRPPARPFKHIPKKGMVIFDSARLDGILKKIMDFNETLASAADKELVLSDGGVSRVAGVVSVLKDTSHYHISVFGDADVVTLLTLLRTWPAPMLFPVLDLVRMVVVHPDGGGGVARHAADVAVEVVQRTTAEGPAVPGNLVTGVRLVANLFRDPGFHHSLHLHAHQILHGFQSALQHSISKNLQLSYSTLLLNYAVLMRERKDVEGQCVVLRAAVGLARGEMMAEDSSSMFRALVAIGSLMEGGEEEVLQTARGVDVAAVAGAALVKVSEGGVELAEVVADILQLLP